MCHVHELNIQQAGLLWDVISFAMDGQLRENPTLGGLDGARLDPPSCGCHITTLNVSYHYGRFGGEVVII